MRVTFKYRSAAIKNSIDNKGCFTRETYKTKRLKQIELNDKKANVWEGMKPMKEMKKSIGIKELYDYLEEHLECFKWRAVIK